MIMDLLIFYDRHSDKIQFGGKGYFSDYASYYNEDSSENPVFGTLSEAISVENKIEKYVCKETRKEYNHFIPKDDYLKLQNGISIEEIIESYDTTGEKNMNSNEMLSNLVTMKMADAMSKGGDMDIGKLMLMQSLTKGQPIKITDVIKSKIISNLKLDGDDLPLEKVMLLQMLDEGQLDVNQLITFKMIGSMFEEKKE